MPDPANPMPPVLLQLVAERFRLLAEPMRLRILDHLRRVEEASVNDLATEIEASQQNLSRHLTILAGAGILSRRKHGNKVCYSIADPTVLALCDLVCGAITERHAELGAQIEAAPQ